MPKDPTENIDRYKVRGGHLNEYEFQKNQQALAEEEDVNFITGNSTKPGRKQATPDAKKTAAKKRKSK